MRNIPVDLLKSFFRDRTMFVATAALSILAVAYCIYVALALEPSDLQVAVRYTAIGDAHFYRDKWYYLVSFILFGVIVSAIHLALAIKLYGREKKQLALLLLIFTMSIIVITWIMARSVLRIAFL